MNIFLHELKSYRKSTIIWSISLAALVILFLSLFPALTKDIEEVKKLMEGFPEAVRNGMGIVFDNFGTIPGYYAFPISFVILIGAIQAMILGTSIVSKEVREKTVDFLLTKPVTRVQILTSKVLAVVTSLVITNVIYNISATLMANAVKKDDYSFKIFFMISITLLFVQLIFMSLGIMISVIVPKIKSAVPISLGTVFAFYFLSFLSTTASDDALRYLTPFKYFDPSYIVKNSAYEVRFVVISLVFIVASITASYVIYCKKDIHAV